MLAVGLLAASMAAAPLPAKAPPAPGPSEEFFIVSSIDPGKGSMVLKRPTEVTLAMRITEKTRFRGGNGKPIRLSDLRAGDTVFIASENDASGQLVASSIREGPMTVPELHRRYLRF